MDEATDEVRDAASGGPRRRRENPTQWARRHRQEWQTALKKDWRLYSLLLIPLIWFLIFRYVPMLGNVIAVRRYRPGGSIFGDEFVGFRYFSMIMGDASFWNAFWNTIILGGLGLIIIFPLPIILALLLNELRSRIFKRTVQTISYLPHFMSIVVVAAMVLQLVSVRGTVNQIITALGGDAIAFMQHAEWFRAIYISSEIWQTVGWGTILYLAALTTIDPQLYEASRVDGASRLRQTWHVTLPGIRPTMIVLLILNIGNFMAVGFEKVLLLQNTAIYSTADVIATYLYRVGLQGGNFSYAAAIGFFEAIIGAVLIVGANFFAKRVVGESLW
ncbi:ABC transporter permease [Bogoriella caseilytica]|uniref:ABC transporter permease n=1 Tax=Bogoriella caseilytica TaxID=56055 RepID=UPI003CCC5C6A